MLDQVETERRFSDVTPKSITILDRKIVEIKFVQVATLAVSIL